MLSAGGNQKLPQLVETGANEDVEAHEQDEEQLQAFKPNKQQVSRSPHSDPRLAKAIGFTFRQHFGSTMSSSPSSNDLLVPGEWPSPSHSLKSTYHG